MLLRTPTLFATFTRLCAFLAVLLFLCQAAIRGDVLDMLQFGNDGSEKTHDLDSDHSIVNTGGLNETARQLLPLDSPGWRGGKVAFTMKVDPARQNYFTARFWGSDVTENRLVLYCDGKQIGWFHLGEIETLDAGNEDGTPAYNDRFFYHTSPLPLSLTTGKTELKCEIRAMGRIWGYGGTWELYQKDMTTLSRSIYRVYTHTQDCFVPPADEKQGVAPVTPTVRPSPGPEVLDQVKQVVNGEIDRELTAEKPLTEIEMQFLAEAYHIKWCDACQKPEVISQVAKGLDNLYALWKGDPKVMDNAPGAYNGGWLRFGPAGAAVALLGAPLQPVLDQPCGDSGVARRAAWSEMLQASRDDARHNRRLYTNQSMIVDLNAYRANRGVAAIDPNQALPESQVLDYLYQSVGIKPWLGSDTDNGPAKPMGDNYWELTSKGLSKELGFVGYYGEVIDWVTSIYDATRPVTADGFGPGDDKIKQQLIKIAKARGVFRYPMLDADGNRAMRIEAIVGWRDEGHYPGNIAYAERESWDGSALYVVAETLDPTLVGYAHQMFADNQFFATLDHSLKNNTKNLRVVAGLLGVPDQYDAVKAQAASTSRLPMSWDQPDFAWTDEEDGVVGVKHGHEIFYASVYWRARNGINFTARIHDTTPTYDRIAEVRQDEEFQPSGETYTYKDWVNFGFGNGGVHIPYPKDMQQAMAGVTVPVAKTPDGVNFPPGEENPFAGRADFYLCRYGNFLVEMNSNKQAAHAVVVPKDLQLKNAPDLVSGKTLDLIAAPSIPPATTVILYLGKK
jgi:hypothetical protein